MREGGDRYPPHLGARIGCYGCSLPGLTGVTAYRREGTGTATIGYYSATV